MGYRAVVWAVAVVCSLNANAQQISGTFQLQDPAQFFGQTLTPRNPLNQGSATFNPVIATDSNGVPLSVGFEVQGTMQTNSEDWIFTFSNGGNPAPSGTYLVGGNALASADLSLASGQACSAQSGTVSLTTAHTESTTSDRVTELQLSFSLDCGGAASVTGSFSYLATSATGGGGAPGGGGGGAGGGSVNPGLSRPPNLGNFPIGGGTTTPTTPVAPPAPALTISAPSTTTDLTSGETATVRLTTSGNSTFASDVTFSASGPPGLTFAFSPTTIASPGSGTTTLTIGTTDALQTGVQRVEILAQGANGVVARTTFNVRVACDPPIIFGVNEPQNTTIVSGQTAQLTVKPAGSGPFNYQWFEGHRGSLVFPVSGATSATLTTPALTAGTEYWVRVTNPCGAIDSQNASVIVNP